MQSTESGKSCSLLAEWIQQLKIARASVSQLQIAYATWYGNQELGTGGVTTFGASIEYPIGSPRIPIFWNGQSTVNVADKSLSPLSDVLPIMITKGTAFRIWTYYYNPSGIIYYQGGYVNNGATNESSATILANKTLSGTVAGTTSVYLLEPAIMVAPITLPSFLGVGDSHMTDNGTAANTTNDLSNDQGIICRSLGPHIPYSTSALTGEFLYNFVANCSKRQLLAPYFTHLINEFGGNDIATQTFAQIMANLNLIPTLFPTLKCFTATYTPHTTSTDSWATLANQTVSATDLLNNIKILLNQNIRSKQLIGFSGVFDTSGFFMSTTDSGLWIPAYVFPGDGLGIHANFEGMNALRRSGIVDPALITR